MGCHALLQGIFPTQELNPGLLNCRRILYRLSHQGSPQIALISLIIHLSLYSYTTRSPNAKYFFFNHPLIFGFTQWLGLVNRILRSTHKQRPEKWFCLPSCTSALELLILRIRGTESLRSHQQAMCVHVRLFAIPWTVDCQAPLSMGLSRQEYWRGLPCPPPGDPPDPGVKPSYLMSLALAGGFFTTRATWEAPSAGWSF